MADAPIATLESIQKRVLWLSALMVHHANSTRPNPDGTKVGGHQASSWSVAGLMPALYSHALRPGDIVATKAHASPILYAIEYLRGRLTAEQLRGLRSLGALQAYPSRRKNPEIIDLSTGSMGLGAVSAAFGALAARYVSQHGGSGLPARFIALVGAAALDAGHVWEGRLEEAVGGHDLAAILAAYEEAAQPRRGPCVILADTIKGWGYPFAADQMNHGTLLTPRQLDELRESLGVDPEDEWAGFPAGSAEAALVRGAPAPYAPPAVEPAPQGPDTLAETYPPQSSTQETFGRLLRRLARVPIR